MLFFQTEVFLQFSFLRMQRVGTETSIDPRKEHGMSGRVAGQFPPAATDHKNVYRGNRTGENIPSVPGFASPLLPRGQLSILTKPWQVDRATEEFPWDRR